MKTEYLVFIANAALYSAVLSNDGYVAAAAIAALTAATHSTTSYNKLQQS